MEKRHAFRVIDGLRQPAPGSPARQGFRDLEKRPAMPAPLSQVVGWDGSADLATALHVTERRLSKLLEDRERLSRDLHDIVLQSLYAIGLSLHAVQRLPKHSPADVRKHAASAIDQLNRLIADVRSTIFGLQSDAVTGFDMESELRTIAQALSYSSTVRIDVAIDLRAAEMVTGEEGRHLVSIAREALSNTLRHARASSACVSFRRLKRVVRFQVVDDGRGIARPRNGRRGFGLANMTTRAGQIGGRLTIHSKPGGGTKIVLDLALERICTEHDAEALYAPSR